MENLYGILWSGYLTLGLLIRITLKDIVSEDASNFLLPWYDSMRNGIFSLRNPVGNYNLFYQFLISLLVYIPVKPLYAYKLLSCLFDYAMAVAAYYWIEELNHDRWEALFAFTCVLLSPVVCINSAAWAQCDVMYTFFIVISLFYLMKEKYFTSFILLGWAFACKLQAVFVFPVYLLVYVVQKKFSVLYFFLVPVMMVISGIPGLLMGRNIMDIFVIYLSQTVTYPSMYLNYPSFWALLVGADQFQSCAPMALFFTIALLALLMLYYIIKNAPYTAENLLETAFLMVYTCVLFLPSMHERYGYCYEVLAIILAFVHKKTLPLCVLLIIIAGISYSPFLFGLKVNYRYLALMNVAVYVVYLSIWLKHIGTSRLCTKNLE